MRVAAFEIVGFVVACSGRRHAAPRRAQKPLCGLSPRQPLRMCRSGGLVRHHFPWSPDKTLSSICVVR